MQKLDAFLHAIDNTSEWSGKIVSYFLFIMVFIILYEIIGRAAFNSATLWAHETSAFIFGSYAVVGGAYTLWLRGHVTVDVLYARLSLRKRAIADVVTSLLFFGFVISLLWWGSALAWNSLSVRETTMSAWRPPLYPFKMTLVLGIFLILLQGTAKFIRDLITAATGRGTV